MIYSLEMPVRKGKERFDFVAIGTDVRALQAFYRREIGVAKGE